MAAFPFPIPVQDGRAFTGMVSYPHPDGQIYSESVIFLTPRTTKIAFIFSGMSSSLQDTDEVVTHIAFKSISHAGDDTQILRPPEFYRLCNTTETAFLSQDPGGVLTDDDWLMTPLKTTAMSTGRKGGGPDLLSFKAAFEVRFVLARTSQIPNTIPPTGLAPPEDPIKVTTQIVLLYFNPATGVWINKTGDAVKTTLVTHTVAMV